MSSTSNMDATRYTWRVRRNASWLYESTDYHTPLGRLVGEGRGQWRLVLLLQEWRNIKVVTLTGLKIEEAKAAMVAMVRLGG